MCARRNLVPRSPPATARDRTIAVATLTLLLVVIIGGCSAGGTEGCEIEGSHFEARAWLASNASISPLATNRFATKAAAVAFVETLYAEGADSVLAVDVWEDDPVGTYTTSIAVFLPDDRRARARLFAISDREAVAQGFAADADQGQRCLLFWWD